MIIKVDGGIDEKILEKMINRLETENNVSVKLIAGKDYSILGLVGDISTIDIKHIQSLDYVLDVQRVQEPYKRASRKFKPEDTIVKVGNVEIGGNNLVMMAGPCSVENEKQIIDTAKAVKAAGATILRGGVVKPRTSPYAFQGLGMEGVKLMEKAKAETGLPIICEIMSISQLHEFGPHVDMIQLGARNMQNFDLLKEVGKLKKPILLKRGLCNTIEEFLMSAEYIMASGNENVILCERGIRTFETATRNTLDLGAVVLLKENVLNSKTAKIVIIEMLKTGKTAKEIIKEKGLEQISDDNIIKDIVKKVLENNMKSVEDYKNGKDRALRIFSRTMYERN